jgi:hypothetical protein
MQVIVSSPNTGTSIHPNPILQTDIVPSNTMSGLVAIAFPVIVIGAIVGYRKYRAAVVRQHIQHLNRLWQLDSSQELS